MPDQLNDEETERRREDALKKMLATPPKPFTPKAKGKVSRPPPTKAEQAAYKRSDKTGFKPAPRKS